MSGKDIEQCIVAKLLPSFDLLLGLDAVAQLGGAYVALDPLDVQFGKRCGCGCGSHACVAG